MRGFDSGVHRPRPPAPTVIEAPSLVDRRRDASTSAGVAQADSLAGGTQPGAARPSRRSSWAVGLSVLALAVVGAAGFLGRARLLGEDRGPESAAAPQAAQPTADATARAGELAEGPAASAAPTEPVVAPAATAVEAVVPGASSAAQLAAPPGPAPSPRPTTSAAKSASPAPTAPSAAPPVRTGGSLKKERDYGF